MRMRDAVAIGLLKINPDFFSIKTAKKPDKETMLKPANISKINAQMLLFCIKYQHGAEDK